MVTAIKIKYVKGIFQPLEKVNLPEGVEVTAHIDPINLNMIKNDMVHVGKKHFLKMLSQLKFTSGVTDASTNHDKYLYDNPHNL